MRQNIPEAQSFYERRAWKSLRYRVLNKFGATCMLCGRGRESGAVIHVDHIKPISIYPELALQEDNLQVLCSDCNQGKSNHYVHDFRPKLKIAPAASSADALVEKIASQLKQDAIRASDKHDDVKSAAALRTFLEFRRATMRSGLSQKDKETICQEYAQKFGLALKAEA